MSQLHAERAVTTSRGSAAEVFIAFLKLGLTSFGGPIAHLGYFQRELIERRRWMDEDRYAQLVALCQLLPGPASSQVGFALGLIRAGWGGAVAAFVGFTLPSALLLFAFAMFLPMLQDPVGKAALHGLKLVAVAVVAQGVLVMARRLTPDVSRALIAALCAAIVITAGSALVQLLVVLLGAAFGFICLRGSSASLPSGSFELRYGAKTGGLLLTLFAVLLAVALIVPTGGAPLWSAASAFYRTGALVFGGGHVVLPLMEEAVVAPGWVSTDDFLAGYGAAQAVPGPLFSVAAFLGARLEGGGGVVAAAIALLSIFLPGLLLVAGSLPVWRTLASRSGAVNAINGVNAAVVGLLAAALYDPLWTSAVFGVFDFAIALVAFVVLSATRFSVLGVLVGCVLASVARLWLFH